MEKNEGIEKPYKFLKKPLNIDELTGAGVQFDFEMDFADDMAGNIFNELNIGSDTEYDDGKDVKKIDKIHCPSPWTRPFAELREKMQKINEFMYKDLTNEASKENIEKGLVPEGARAAIRYSGYWEGEGTPFDSSFLRGTAFNFVTGNREVLEGLECAVRTMYEGESATFLISYKLLFLELGCPPRIKPSADGLFTIELLNFNLVGDIDAVDKLSEEDRNKFSVLIDNVKQMHLKGLDCFKQGFYVNAVRSFERCVESLTFSRLANEEEEIEQKKFLIKLHTNLAVCYNKINAPSKACIMVREVKNLTNNNPSCKVIFQEGRALLMLGEFERARDCLKRANKMEPHNVAIMKELETLNIRFAKYKNSEREIWSKAMGVVNKFKNHEEDAVNKVNADIKTNIGNLLQEFKDNEKLNKMEVPQDMMDNYSDIVTELCELMDITLSRSQLENNVSTISKKNKDTKN